MKVQQTLQSPAALLAASLLSVLAFILVGWPILPMVPSAAVGTLALIGSLVLGPLIGWLLFWRRQKVAALAVAVIPLLALGAVAARNLL